MKILLDSKYFINGLILPFATFLNEVAFKLDIIRYIYRYEDYHIDELVPAIFFTTTGFVLNRRKK